MGLAATIFTTFALIYLHTIAWQISRIANALEEKNGKDGS